MEARLRDNEYIALSMGITTDDAKILDDDQISRNICLSSRHKIYSHHHLLPSILQPYLADIANRFDWKSYRKCNKDLSQLKPCELVEHFLRNGITDWRRHWKSSSRLMDRRYAIAFHSNTDIHLRTRIQAVVHCYHYNVLCYLLPYLRNISRIGGDIHLLVTNNKLSDLVLDDFLTALNTGFTSHSWARVSNYGEDWSSFHHAFDQGFFSDDGITFKIQTKLSSSLGIDGGAVWIDDALGPLCSSSSAILKTLMVLDNQTSVIAASKYVRCKGFGANPELVRDYVEKMKLGPPEAFCNQYFSGGSMFAASNKIIRSFYDRLGPVDYAATVEGGNEYCGRFIGHALERVFFYHALVNGMGEGSVAWIV